MSNNDGVPLPTECSQCGARLRSLDEEMARLVGLSHMPIADLVRELEGRISGLCPDCTDEKWAAESFGAEVAA